MNILGAESLLWKGGLTVSYTIRDAAGNTSEGSVKVTPVDAPPVARADAATAVAGQTVAIDVLSNDTDPEGGALTLAGATAERGTVTVADGTLRYTAPADFAGTDTVTYQVRDAAGNPASGTVTVTVTAPAAADQPPVAGADAATVVAGGTITIDVLSNDTDPEGGALTLTSATAERGTVAVSADNTLTYTAPAGSAATSDTVRYEVRDPGGNTRIGTVAVTVEAADLPPVAGDDAATAIAGETITIDVLANDADPEGGALTVVAAEADRGSVAVNADGTLRFTAPAGFVGTATIGYTIRDAAGHTAEGGVTVRVDPLPNEPPVAGDDTAAVATPGGTITIDVLGNDTDPEGGPLSVTGASAEVGSVSVNTDGTLSYTAPTGFSGVDTVTYGVRDQGGKTDEGRVTVTVTPLQLVIDETTTIGDFAVEAGDGAITVTIIEPAGYAGTHVIETADLARGPINLVPASITGNTAVGSTLTAVPGIWATDESHGAVSFAQRWLRGTAAIAGATEPRYVIGPEDPASGLHYVREARNTAGRRSVSVEALRATPVGQAFAERGVRFTAPSKLVRNADLAPADSPSVVFFSSFVPHATGRQGILRQSSIYNGIEIWDGKFQFRATMSGASRVVDSRLLTAGQRASFLAVAGASGSSTVLRLFSRFAGESGWTDEKTDTGGSGPIDLTLGGFSVGGRHGGTGQDLNATVYRIACWSGVTLDLGDPAVFVRFLQANGTLADPASSRGLLGTPRVDLFGPAEEYVTGINHGTAGTFDSVGGTFTNA